jgi:rhodanese-related sulfurtransferase
VRVGQEIQEVPRRLTRRFHVPSALRPSALRIEPGRARSLVDDGALLIDVRRADDQVARLDGALRLPPDMIPERLSGFRRDVPIVLACT